MKSPGLYWRTLRHLTPRQLIYQVWNRLRGRPRLNWTSADANVPSLPLPITFTLLNQSVTFTERIDWNYATNGKLWTYTLNYFDWLTPPEHGSTLTPYPFSGQGGDSIRDGVALIHAFIQQTNDLRDGLEPYPTSLRLLNWRSFLLREGIQDSFIERHMYAQTALLRSRLEYHLGGNHLLENACALTMMAVHFQHRLWFADGAKLLANQLHEQFLTDGGHYERSPVYHQLLTGRLLDLYAVLLTSSWVTDATLIRYVREKIAAMLNWLVTVTFRDGSVPMVNDAAYGVAPTTAGLLAKAAPLGFRPTQIQLTDSGYRMLTTPRLEVFIDVAPVGPDHQPGHAHADTFSFVLHIDGQPVVVDPGTSTYQIGERRRWERSTAAHNTVTVSDQNSSELWSGFRVGRRAQVTILTDLPCCVEAAHDGYAYLGDRHTRRWTLLDETTLRVDDCFIDNNLARKSHLYFDHYLYLTTEQQVVTLANCAVQFVSEKPLSVNLTTYDQALGFNRTATASCVSLDVPTTVMTTLFTVRL
ncbi:heparinase II/III domain-containing protein [Fibrella arboris]|uniref:heparinase II/III domain-containing protein n=1 Tax=Fibrella arboris TaxID=3242486 RepID=UPI003520C999